MDKTLLLDFLEQTTLRYMESETQFMIVLMTPVGNGKAETVICGNMSDGNMGEIGKALLDKNILAKKVMNKPEFKKKNT